MSKLTAAQIYVLRKLALEGATLWHAMWNPRSAYLVWPSQARNTHFEKRVRIAQTVTPLVDAGLIEETGEARRDYVYRLTHAGRAWVEG